MHLWPSVRIRDSFKISYLKKLEWNLNRMNSEKKQQSQSNDQQQTLLVDDNNQRNDNSETPSAKKSHFGSGFVAVCGEILMVLSCCYCCFCCGGFLDKELANSHMEPFQKGTRSSTVTFQVHNRRQRDRVHSAACIDHEEN